jgi:hypothetical protein
VSSASALCRGEEVDATDLGPLAAGSFAGLITAAHSGETRCARCLHAQRRDTPHAFMFL